MAAPRGLEAHRVYIDVPVTLSGDMKIGWRRWPRVRGAFEEATQIEV
jgi:hypothetical protein